MYPGNQRPLPYFIPNWRRRGNGRPPSWVTRPNDTNGALDEEDFLSFPTNSAPQPTNQGASSTSVVHHGPVPTIPGIHNRRDQARIQRNRALARQSQAVSPGHGNHSLEEGPVWGWQQQSFPSEMQPSTHFNAFQQQPMTTEMNTYYPTMMDMESYPPMMEMGTYSPMMAMDTPSSIVSALPSYYETMNASMQQWEQPVASNPSGPVNPPFFNMGTGNFEDPTGDIMAASLENSPRASYINFPSSNFNNLELTDFGSMGSGVGAIPLQPSTPPPSYTLYQNTTPGKNESPESLNNDRFYIEPPNVDYNDAFTSQLLTDIFGPEISANTTSPLRLQPPPYARADNSPPVIVAASPEPVGTPRLHSVAMHTAPSPPGRVFEGPNHPTTLLRASINESPTRVGVGKSRQPVIGTGVEFPPPKPVAPEAPVKPKRNRLDSSSPFTAVAKRARHTRRASAPITGSASLASSPASGPSVTSTPKKRGSPRNRPVPYPKDWESASGGDILLFELKNAGSTWAQITETYNGVHGTDHSVSSLQGRYHGIRRCIGNLPGSIPEEEGELPACLEGYVIDADGIHSPTETVYRQSEQSREAGDENPNLDA